MRTFISNVPLRRIVTNVTFSAMWPKKENTGCIKLRLIAALKQAGLSSNYTHTGQDSITSFIKEKVLRCLLQDVGMDKLELFLISVCAM
jgi:hypothetical protein